MNSYRRNNRKRSGLAITTAIVIGIFLLDAITGGHIRTFVRAAASDLWLGVDRIFAPLHDTGLFSSRRALEADNQTLQNEVASLQARAAESAALQSENASLRSLVHLAANSPGITAPIISSFKASPYGTFVVGAGTSEGIALGNLVMADDSPGVVIGKVTELSAHTALVTELFAPNVTTEALAHGVPLVLEGSGGENARADAPRDAPIEVGDPVTSPALGSRAIGVVAAVEDNTTTASRTVYVNLSIDVPALSFVYVVTK